MSLLERLCGFTLRQVFDEDLLDRVDVEALGEVAGGVGGRVVQVVANHFRDHSQTLSGALCGVPTTTPGMPCGVALAQVTVGGTRANACSPRGDARDNARTGATSFAGQSPASGARGRPAEFRSRRPGQYQRAYKAKSFELDTGSPLGELGQQAARFARHSDRPEPDPGANKALADVAEQLQQTRLSDLAWLLQQPAADGAACWPLSSPFSSTSKSKPTSGCTKGCRFNTCASWWQRK